MHTPYGGEEHLVGDPQRHMWEPRWRAIPGVQSPDAGLLLANHEGELHRIHPEMLQVPTVLTSVKSPSKRAHFNDQPMVVYHLGD